MDNRYVDAGSYAFKSMTGAMAPVSREQYAQTVQAAPVATPAPLAYKPKAPGKLAGLTQELVGEDIDESAPIEDQWTEKDEYEAQLKKQELDRIYGTGGSADEVRRQKELRKKARQDAKNTGVLPALGQGFVSGLTLGVSDYTGGEEAIERKSAVQRARPFASGAGQLAGMVIPVVATEILTGGAAPTGEAAAARAATLAAKFPKVFKALAVAQKVPGIKQMKAARTAIQASKMPAWAKTATDAALVGGTLAVPHAAAGAVLDTTRPLGERIGTGAMEVGIGAAASGIAAPILGIATKYMRGTQPEIAEGFRVLGATEKDFVKTGKRFGVDAPKRMAKMAYDASVVAKGDPIKTAEILTANANTTIDTMYEGAMMGLASKYGKKMPTAKQFVKSIMTREVGGADGSTVVADLFETPAEKKIFEVKMESAVFNAMKKGENPYRAMSRVMRQNKFKYPTSKFQNAAMAWENAIDDQMDEYVQLSIKKENARLPKAQRMDETTIHNRYKKAKAEYAASRQALDHLETKAIKEDFRSMQGAGGDITGNSNTSLKMKIGDAISGLLQPNAGRIGAGGLAAVAGGGGEVPGDIQRGDYGEALKDAGTALVSGIGGYVGGNLATKALGKYGVPMTKAAGEMLGSAAVPAAVGQGARGLATASQERPEDIADIREEALGEQAAPAPRVQDGASVGEQTTPTEKTGGEWYQKGRGSGFVDALVRKKMLDLERGGQLPEGYTFDMAKEDYIAMNGDQLKNNPRKYAVKIYDEAQMKMFDEQYRDYLAREDALSRVDFAELVPNLFDTLKSDVHTGASRAIAIDKAADALYAYETASKPGVTPSPAKEKMRERKIEAIVKSSSLSPAEKYKAIHDMFGKNEDGLLRNIGLTE